MGSNEISINIIHLNFDEKIMGTWEQDTGSGRREGEKNSAGDL